MVNLNGITYTDNGDGTSTLARVCPFCGKSHSITVNNDEMEAGSYAIERGVRIQDAFPTWTPDEREFLMTGICSKCWKSM